MAEVPVYVVPVGYELPTVGDFRMRFPEFPTVPDEMINMMIMEGSLWVDYDWMTPDYQIAILYFAAHQASLARRAALASGAVGAGQVVSSVSFRDRSVSYFNPQAVAIAAAGSSWQGQLDSTPYGMMFRMYMYRNAPPVLIV